MKNKSWVSLYSCCAYFLLKKKKQSQKTYLLYPQVGKIICFTCVENCFFLPQAEGSEVHTVFASSGQCFPKPLRTVIAQLACLTEAGSLDGLVGLKDQVLTNDATPVL